MKGRGGEEQGGYKQEMGRVGPVEIIALGGGNAIRVSGLRCSWLDDYPLLRIKERRQLSELDTQSTSHDVLSRHHLDALRPLVYRSTSPGNCLSGDGFKCPLLSFVERPDSLKILEKNQVEYILLYPKESRC